MRFLEFPANSYIALQYMGRYSATEWTDNRLLDLIRLEDDLDAFSELYRRYWAPLLNAAFKRLKTKESAEEAVQSIFVSFFMRRREINFNAPLEAYLRNALKLHIFYTYRKQHSHERYVQHEAAKMQAGPVMPDRLLERKELKAQIQAIAEKMPEKCREVFLLSRIEQLSQQDIATKLGISVSTVKKHLHKATGILRVEFSGRQFDLVLVSMVLLLRS